MEFSSASATAFGGNCTSAYIALPNASDCDDGNAQPLLYLFGKTDQRSFRPVQRVDISRVDHPVGIMQPYIHRGEDNTVSYPEQAKLKNGN